MNVFEKFIARETPPSNGSVLWINTSRTPITLNMEVAGQWQVLGAFYDAEILTAIKDALVNLNIEDHPEITTIADFAAYVIKVLDMPTEAETKAMFVLNN